MTGAGAIRPFGGIGQGNVIFDQAIGVQKGGSGSIGGTALVQVGHNVVAIESLVGE